MVVSFGLLFRITLLPAGLRDDIDLIDGLKDDLTGRYVTYRTFLLYDQNVWRCLWEGYVLSQGLNPYRLAPAVVHAWYVTWLIPLACLTRSRTWISFSAVVYLSFLVMLDGVERPWARIDPHPAFRMVKLATRFSRGRGRLDTQVHDSVEGLSSDSPSAVLSSSQLNALAVSLFLSLNLALPRLPVEAALLDDPIQSLDDSNLLGLVDLLRRTKDKRQLIVSTHDERFGKLLARKLRPTSGNQRTSVIELSGWTRGGPEVRQYAVEPESTILKLVHAG